MPTEPNAERSSGDRLLPAGAELMLAVAAAGVGLAAAYATLFEPRWLQRTEATLPLPGLPAAWEGARVAHLSDPHFGDPWSATVFRKAVRAVNQADVDLVVITGDFVVEGQNRVPRSARLLEQLRSRRGVLAVLGDHDYRSAAIAGELPARLHEAGVRLLRNETITLEGGLRVCGVEPCTRKTDRSDLGRALAGAEPPHLLLTHSPDLLPRAAEHGVPVLLCGHTHGGQVVVPFLGPPVTHTRVPRRHASGWSQWGETRAYTNRGLGSHFSLRFLCRPEIALFTLTGSHTDTGA